MVYFLSFPSEKQSSKTKSISFKKTKAQAVSVISIKSLKQIMYMTFVYLKRHTDKKWLLRGELDHKKMKQKKIA